MWPVAICVCESLAIHKDDEARIKAFEIKCLWQIFGTARKTNEWLLEAAGAGRSLVGLIKERKLSYLLLVFRCSSTLEQFPMKPLAVL